MADPKSDDPTEEARKARIRKSPAYAMARFELEQQRKREQISSLLDTISITSLIGSLNVQNDAMAEAIKAIQDPFGDFEGAAELARQDVGIAPATPNAKATTPSPRPSPASSPIVTQDPFATPGMREQAMQRYMAKLKLMTQAELARKIGVDPADISKWKRRRDLGPKSGQSRINRIESALLPFAELKSTP